MKKFSCYKLPGIILLSVLLSVISLSCTNGEPRHVPSKNLIPPDSNEYLSSEPVLILPEGYDISDLIIKESDMQAPKKINSHFTPIGKIYDIGLAGVEHPDFGGAFAELIFSYDKYKLAGKGFIEEFMVFYFDDTESTWKPVDSVIGESEKSTVTAFTGHFTPFVLTAVPAASGTVAEPPACIGMDYPDGIGGSGNAVFSVVDENFRYYRDRDYFIKPTAESDVNAVTFEAFGFASALGISTINGNSPLGEFSEHKRYKGKDYIVFTAHTDLDLYVMYDTRGGEGMYDTSMDAPWLSDPDDPDWQGFTADIDVDGTPGRYFVETTDPARYYTVYRKSYNQGEEVRLHGNLYGTADSRIDTNYWVIIKRHGDLSSGYASELCEADPDTSVPVRITNLSAFPGSSVVALTWQNPDDPAFAGSVVRRSVGGPPMGIDEGVEPSGEAVTAQSYIDRGLSEGVEYYYTVFSVDRDGHYLIGESVRVTTSKDGDNDGLSDEYESARVYDTGMKSDPLLADSDGDGKGDGDELALGTDPTNPDITAPVIMDFTRTSLSPTGDPDVLFSIEGEDDTAVTGWLISRTSAKPLSSNTNWQEDKPVEYRLSGPPGTYSLFSWARDAAGNVSECREIIIEKDIALSGYVRDGHDVFIPGALIRLYNGGFSEYTVSDESGYYEFIEVPAGIYNLVATKDGFELFTQVVTLS